jgi:two-component sensor histidine kinase
MDGMTEAPSARDQQALVTAIEHLTEATSVADVGRIVRSAARQIAEADAAAFVLREEDHCAFVDEEAPVPLVKGSRYALAECASGWAMLNQTSLAIPDIHQDERVADALKATFVRSMAVFPIRPSDPVAAVGVYWAESRLPTARQHAWLETLARTASTAIANVRLVEALAHALAAAEQARQEAEFAQDELRHRVKNAYATAQAVARLRLPPEQAERMQAPLVALARTQDLLDRQLAHRPEVDLKDLAWAELEAYAGGAAGRVTLDGPPLALPGRKATALALLLNEAATNSLKHGALSAEGGRLTLAWRVQDGRLRLEWVERGGPPVAPPKRESFGSRMMERVVTRNLGGVLTRRFPPEGLELGLDVPL